MGERRTIYVHKARTALVVWAVSVLAAVPFAACRGVRAASPGPTVAEIAQRVLAVREASRVASADVHITVYVDKPVTGRPNCTFAATMHVDQGRSIIQLGQRPLGLTCVIVERRGLRPLFKSVEPLEAFFAGFSLSVVGQKTDGAEQYYLIQGRARDPKGDPRGFTALIDYTRGVIVGGTTDYAWGDMRITQTYARIHGAWVLTEQVLFAPRYNATVKIVYRHFRFAPQ